MAVRPPGKDELAAIARGYGMHLSDQDAVEELYAQTAPRPAGRDWMQPAPGAERAACLRVAHAFERLSGGFPAPPAAA